MSPDFPQVDRVVAVWIGRDEEGRAAAVLYCLDESTHYCLREEGTWRLIAVNGADGEEYRVEEEPELTLDPVEVAVGLHQGDIVPPYDPNMN